MKEFKIGFWVSAILTLTMMTMIGCSNKSAGPADVTPGDADTTPPIVANWVGTTFDGDHAVGTIPLNNYLPGFTDSSNMLSCSRIEGGILKFDTSIAGGSPHFDSPTNLNLDTVTVIARVRGSGSSVAVVDFDLYNGTNRQRVQFNSGGKIQVSGEQMGRPDGDFANWHTYMISYKQTAAGLETYVYVDGSSIPVTYGIALDPPGTTKYLRIGDGSGSADYSGEIDWFYYTTDGAFTPTNVVLPDGISLK